MDAALEVVHGRRPGSSVEARLFGLLILGLASVGALAETRAVVGRMRSTVAVDPPQLVTELAPDPAGRLHGAAALLATSVLTDSGIEHYRGRFENPGMFASLVAAAMTLVAGLAGVRRAGAAKAGRAALPADESAATATAAAGSAPAKTIDRAASAHDPAYVAATAVGLAGIGFHIYDLLRRPGGLRWSSLFYGAPLGAPAALSMAGLLGLSAGGLRRARATTPPRLLGMPAGPALAALTGVGLAGTAAEAGLLHFRGSFQNPLMWLPVSLPPVAAGLMMTAAVKPSVATGLPGRMLRGWLKLTALLGVAGAGLHAYGVARQMGGWKNWRQNLLSGPPVPAPPAFSALALAGSAALSLLDDSESAREAAT